MQRLHHSARFFVLCLVAAVLFSWNLAHAQDVAPTPLRYDIADAVDDIAEKLASGSDAGQRALEGLDAPTSQTLNRMLEGQDFRYVGFSARTKMEALYHLAEAHSSGEGERFLAKLHRRIAATSGAVALEPALQTISRRFTSEELTADLAFADPRVLRDNGLSTRQLPTHVRNAVDLLCRVVAPEEFGTVVDLVERHFRFSDPPRQVINRAIMQSVDRREALGLMIRSHGPPPSVQEATRRLVMDMAATSAAISMDERIARAVNELAEEPLPEALRRYRDVADGLPSRIAQALAAPGGTGVSRTMSEAAARAMTADVLRAGGVEALGPERPARPGPSYDETRQAHADYSARVHSDAGVPRSYSRAIRSSRAARGIAVGGQVEGPDSGPQRVFWLASRESPDFGRIAVEMPGRQRLLATRHLFADSFEAAVGLLWGDHGTPAAFRNGEVVILVSMDPESSVGSTGVTAVYEDVQQEIEELARLVAGETDFSRTLELYERAVELEAEMATRLAEIPRGIVVHPALHGRELAWSGVRVDFWFNALDRVGEEGLALNGGIAMPREAREAWTGSAGTWQFYERDSRITFASSAGPGDALLVRSRGGDSAGGYSSDNHFSVALFAFGDAQPSATAERDTEEGVWRLLGEEAAVQPLLDWMFGSHYDFMRLNDFSESLSILRWVAGSGQQLVILDPDGAPAKVATPDRVFVGEVGPHAGERR